MYLLLKSKPANWLSGFAVLRLLVILAGLSTAATGAAEQHATALAEAIASEHRTAAFVARDQYRHPLQTLNFFEVAPDMTVVEIWPGAGWYTEVLAPYLKAGVYYAAHFPSGQAPYYEQSVQKYQQKLAADPDTYGAVQVRVFDPANGLLDVPAATADRVLTFRNVHNWLRSGSEQKAFELFFNALKPGGILGVVEHRAKPGADLERMRESGYVTEAYVIELAEKAGFVLDGRSEVNANAKDTADHPKGVWTLPPSLRLQEQDQDKYRAIGESDRMTLRFKKPVTAE